MSSGSFKKYYLKTIYLKLYIINIETGFGIKYPSMVDMPLNQIT